MPLENENIPRLMWVKISDIKIPDVRLHSHIEDVNDFQESVKSEGILEPVYILEDENGNRWLADGQNRLSTAKNQGRRIIPAFVMKGSQQDAVLFSVKLNVLRGKVNVGELAELVLHFKTSFNWTVEKIASELRLSKGYVSKLLAIAENTTVLEKAKNGLLSLEEAYNEVLGFLRKPFSEEKASFDERGKIQGVQKSEDSEVRQPLTDEDLGFSSNLKVALEEGKRFKPLGPDDLKAETRKSEFMTCDYCGKILSRLDVRWIRVHVDEYDKVLLGIKRLAEAERESQTGSSQP